MIHDRFTLPMTLKTATLTGIDDYGTPAIVETETAVVGHYRQTSADERREDTTLGGWRLYFPAGTVLDAADRVGLDDVGIVVEVTGPPKSLYDPRRRLALAVVASAEITR
jgi:hypothetical protein